MKTFLLALAMVLSMCGYAQPFTPGDQAFIGNTITTSAAAGPGNAPTNFGGISSSTACIGWWLGANYLTNASVPQIADSTGNGYTMTNLSPTTYYYPTNDGTTLNGNALVSFGLTRGNSLKAYLRNDAISITNPQHIFIVMSPIVATTGNQPFLVTTNGTYSTPPSLIFSSQNNLRLQNNANNANAIVATNHWYMIEGLCDSAASSWILRTNNVTAQSVTASPSATIGGLIIGYDTFAGNNIPTMRVAEWWILNAIQNSTYENNAWNYVTNKYGVLP